MSDIKLYNGDCLDIMNNLIKDGIKVDTIITDPPYNISRPNNFQTMGVCFKNRYGFRRMG